MAWGYNGFMIDSSSTTSFPTPRRWEIPSEIISVSLSKTAESVRSGVFGLTSDGSIFVWGSNPQGSLGISDEDQVKVPTKLPISWKCKAIAAGSYHTLALAHDGSVWTWGGNQFGQLGYKGVQQSYTPVKLQGLNDVVEIAAGTNSSFAITRDGRIWGWGNNGSGMLVKDVLGANQYTPVIINVPCTITSLKEALTSRYGSALISPNPSSERISIAGGSEQDIRGSMLRLYSSTGECVLETTIVDTNSIDISSLPQGFYVAVLSLGSKAEVGSLVKVRR